MVLEISWVIKITWRACNRFLGFLMRYRVRIKTLHV